MTSPQRILRIWVALAHITLVLFLVSPVRAEAEKAESAKEETTLSWHTFLGSDNVDHGNSIAVDGSGNVYITGTSDVTWGSPVSEHSGGNDVFVAMLSGSGALEWHSFLGSAEGDIGTALVVDGKGNAYVAGYSDTSWGSPVTESSGGKDGFVAKLSKSGDLLWHTFLGGASEDALWSIVLDKSGNIFVAGESAAAWGPGEKDFAGGGDAFVAKLSDAGALEWNTFLGSESFDSGYAVTVDQSGNVFVSGESQDSWGEPENDFAGGGDAFVASLKSSGDLKWHTFLGSGSGDYGSSIAVDGSGNVYVGGHGDTSWGSPVRAHSGGIEAFAAKLESSGDLAWHTFLGSESADYGSSVAVDGSGNIILGGSSDSTWGSPARLCSGGGDAFAARLDDSGVLQGSTFVGCAGGDHGSSVALDDSGDVYIVGYSEEGWGKPKNAYSGSTDVFVAKLKAFW